MKNIMRSSAALLGALILSACNFSTQPPQVNNFDDCAAAGNPVMESYPRQCIHQGKHFVEQIDLPGSTMPAPGGSEPAPPPLILTPPNEKACTREYKPVCGEVQVECIRAPCPPLKTTFANRCVAENEGAKIIAEGECPSNVIDPEGACLAADGNWVPEARECEWISAERCKEIGGLFNECASACRNDPNAEICTMQCVQVCQF